MKRVMVVIVLAGILGIVVGVVLSPHIEYLIGGSRTQPNPGSGQDRTPAPPAKPDMELESGTLTESFADGKLSLNWQAFPGFSPDEMRAVSQADTPENDSWVGKLTNERFGGFASLSYAGNKNLRNYSIEAWVYVDASSGEQSPLHGIAIRVDPENKRFYRMAIQSGDDAKLSLAYVGSDTNNFPVFLKEWRNDDVPGGIPAKPGWHKMKVTAVDDKLHAFWDEKELPGSPISDSRIEQGYFGVYANFVGGRQVAQTLVDEVIVRKEDSAR